jgi:uncharacterized protein (TIGR02466 family)
MAIEEGKLGVTSAFPTFVCTYKWPNVEGLNWDLAAELYKVRGADPEGIYRSNIAGTWHSADRVLEKCGEPGKKLGQMFFQVFTAMADCHGGKKGGKYEMGLTAWAMMYSDRGYSTPHTHPNCHFSGVYYVATDDGDAEPKTMATGVKVRPGTLEFIDVRGGPAGHQVQGLTMNPALRIPPEPGLMVVFPAWLPHFVHPVDGGKERLAVACNAGIRKYHLPSDNKQTDGEKKTDDP